MKITEQTLDEFKEYLIKSEKSRATVEKYVHDTAVFKAWLGERTADKDIMLEYKEHLKSVYAPVSVNAAISSLNSLFRFMGQQELVLKTIRIQKKLFSGGDREMKLKEYKSLLRAAKKSGKSRIRLIIQTMFVTGIRISELKHITVEAIESGTAVIDCKGKVREVFIPKDMCNILKKYIRDNEIKSGSVFVTRTGRPVDRSNISKAMKKLAELAKVAKENVFPHNLRHLFARVHYSAYKDIVRLADILGHSSVNTTRIYTMESGSVHRRQIEKLGLTLC